MPQSTVPRFKNARESARCWICRESMVLDEVSVYMFKSAPAHAKCMIEELVRKRTQEMKQRLRAIRMIEEKIGKRYIAGWVSGEAIYVKNS